METIRPYAPAQPTAEQPTAPARPGADARRPEPGRDPAGSPVARRVVLRRRLGIGAIVACLPYLSLKLLWVLGADVGVVDRSEFGDTSWIVVNLVTFLMDGVAALIAYALTRPGGPPGPAWLVALPMWVASGLLAVIMVAVPLGLAGSAFGAPNPFASDGFLEPWVYALVYGGFIAEGVVLLGAFALYADERWGALLNSPATALRQSLPPVLRAAGYTAAVLLAAAAAVRTAWASGAEAGLSAARLEELGATQRFVEGSQAGFALAAAAALLVLLRGRNVRLRLPLTLAWVGAAVAFGWGGFIGVGSTLVPGEHGPTAVMTAVYIAEAAAALLLLGGGMRALGRAATKTKRT